MDSVSMVSMVPGAQYFGCEMKLNITAENGTWWLKGERKRRGEEERGRETETEELPAPAFPPSGPPANWMVRLTPGVGLPLSWLSHRPIVSGNTLIGPPISMLY